MSAQNIHTQLFHIQNYIDLILSISEKNEMSGINLDDLTFIRIITSDIIFLKIIFTI